MISKVTQIGGFIKSLADNLAESEVIVVFFDLDIFESSSLLAAYSFLRGLTDEEEVNFPGIRVNKGEIGFLESIVATGLLSAWDFAMISEDTQESIFFSHDNWYGTRLREGTSLSETIKRFSLPEGH